MGPRDEGHAMRKLLLCGIALGTMATANIAAAADMLLKAPPLPSWSWAGFYAGVNVGYGWASDPTTLTDTTTTTLTRVDDADTPTPIFIPLGTTTASAVGSGNIDPRGWLGGIQGGYNWQSRSMVWGIEGDIQASGQRGSITICDTVRLPCRLWHSKRQLEHALVRNAARALRLHALAALACLWDGRSGGCRDQGQRDGRAGRRRCRNGPLASIQRARVLRSAAALRPR